MSWDDAIMEGFWVFQDDEYAKFCMCKHYAMFQLVWPSGCDFEYRCRHLMAEQRLKRLF